MNPDTDKADELLRTEIERLIVELDECAKHDPDTKKALEPVIFLSGRKLSLLETIHKDREALKATLEQMLSHAGWRRNFDKSGKELPMTRPPGVAEAEKLATQALASQDQTLIKALS